MNPHYHPYGASELTSLHSPPPTDSPGYGMPHLSNGHLLRPSSHLHHAASLMSAASQSHDHHLTHHSTNTHHAFNSNGSSGPSLLHHHISNNTNNNPVKICAGCGGKILERFLLYALDGYWHNSCLKCSSCGTMLADIGSSCFTRGGMILCRNDYMRLFGNTGACSACGQTIPATEFVMRTGSSSGQSPGPSPQSGNGNNNMTTSVFHLKCFACSKCGARLEMGDRYCMLAGSIVCEQDWHKLLKGTSTVTSTASMRKGKVGRPRRTRD